jgi:hypothetical protein
VGKRSLGRPRSRWVDDIKMDLGETDWDGLEWIYLAEDRNQWKVLVDTILKLWVP